MKAFIHILLFLGLCSTWAEAQHSLPADSSTVAERHIPTSLSELRKEKEYSYMPAAENPLSSWWDNLLAKIRKKYTAFFKDEAYGAYKKFFIYILLALAFVYLLLRVIGIQVLSPFQRGDVEVAMPYTSRNETIYGRNFEKEADEAISKRDLKLAVRIYYLRMLKELTEKGLIHWQADKTNRSYFYEIPPDLRKEFGDLTEAFEYCWYGHFEIRDQDFSELKSRFEQFKAAVR